MLKSPWTRRWTFTVFDVCPISVWMSFDHWLVCIDWFVHVSFCSRVLSKWGHKLHSHCGQMRSKSNVYFFLCVLFFPKSNPGQFSTSMWYWIGYMHVFQSDSSGNCPVEFYQTSSLVRWRWRMDKDLNSCCLNLNSDSMCWKYYPC